MPTYSPPQQVLFQPVTDFYRGKAIRQQLKAGEQDVEFKDLQIKAMEQDIAAAPSKREAAKELALLNRENIQSQIDKRVRDGEIAELELSAKALTPLLEDYKKEKDEDKALEAWNKNIGSVISVLSEAEQARIIEAAGPDKQYSHEEIMSTGLGVRLFSDAEKGGAFTLAPGAKRYDVGGEEIASNIGIGGSGRQRDDEIRDATSMLENMGIPDAKSEAIKIVDGLVKYIPDPSGGVIYRIDTIKGTANEVNINMGERGPRPTVDPDETLWALASKATGIIPTTAAGVSIISGALGGPIAEEVVTARQKFKAAENSLIRAFSLNPRYPVAEQNRIKENIAIGPKFWDSKGLMQARMTAIDAFLRQELALAEFESRRPGIDKKQRADEESTSAGIRGFLGNLGVPQQTQDVEIEDLPPIPDALRDRPDIWRSMSPERRELFQ